MNKKSEFDNLQLQNYKKIKDWDVFDIRNNNNKCYFETPFMLLPFGLEKEYSDYVIKLQFQGVNNKTNTEMIEFYELIKYFENRIIDIRGIEKNEFKSQIINKENYDDVLIIKIKKKFFNIDIKNKNSEIKNIFDLKKQSKIKCFLHVDNLWSSNKMNIVKFILDKIIIDEES